MEFDRLEVEILGHDAGRGFTVTGVRVGDRHSHLLLGHTILFPTSRQVRRGHHEEADGLLSSETRLVLRGGELRVVVHYQERYEDARCEVSVVLRGPYLPYLLQLLGTLADYRDLESHHFYEGELDDPRPPPPELPSPPPGLQASFPADW